MKFCFYARKGQTELFAHMAAYFKKKNILSIFVVQNSYGEKAVKRIIPNAVIYNLSDYLKENWGKFGSENLEVLKNRYSLDIFWEMFYADRYLVNYNYNEAIRFLIGHVYFYEMVFEKEKPDIFFNEAIAIYSSYVAYLVGKKYGVEYYGFIIARDSARSKFFFFRDPYQTNHKMKELYYSDIEFTEDELKNAKDYINKFHVDNKVPSYMEKYLLKPRLRLKYLTFFPLTLLSFLRRKYHNKYDYEEYKKHTGRLKIIKEYFSYLRSKKYFKQPIKDDKYYLYTLHMQPEASTLVCASKYEKQLFVIDNLAKSIPVDTKLYVKEHYACLGHRGVAFYKELKKYPNVRLIDPFYPIKDLIINSEAVIVLTSTTGFEAILLKKPVYVLGNVFYDFFPDVQKISDIFNERQKLREPKNIDEKRLVRFVCSYLKSLYEGCVYYGLPEFNTEDNVMKICDAFIKEIGL